MRNEKRKGLNDEFNFWQPASDMFSALMLILMLVILLLCLYLVQVPEHSQIDPWSGDTTREVVDPDATAAPEPTPFFWVPDSGGGQGEGVTPIPSIEPTASPTPSVTP